MTRIQECFYDSTKTKRYLGVLQRLSRFPQETLIDLGENNRLHYESVKFGCWALVEECALGAILVCLFVSRIMQKVLDGFLGNLVEGHALSP